MNPPTLPRSVWLMIAVHVVVTAGFNLMRLWGYGHSLHDMGVVDQALWSFRETGFPFITVNPPYEPRSWLAFHFSPFLLLLAFLPSPEWLNLSYNLAISLSAWPLYLFLRALGSAPRTSLWLVAAYLVNPHLLAAANWDMHEQGIALPFFTLALWALVASRFLLYCLCMAALLLCKEHFGIAVAGFGLLWAWHQRDVTRGLLLSLAGLFACALILGWVMPAYDAMLPQSRVDESLLNPLQRYRWMEAPDIASMIHAAAQQLLSTQNLFYLLSLLLPLAFLPLLAPLWLLPAGADVAANMMSQNYLPTSLGAYHSLTIIPLLMAAAARALQSRMFMRHASANAACICLLSGLLSLAMYPPFQLMLEKRVAFRDLLTAPPHASIAPLRALVATCDSLAVDEKAGYFFTHHPRVYDLSEYERSTCLLMRPDASAWQATRAQFMDMEAYRAGLAILPAQAMAQGFHILYWQDGWLMLHRNITNDAMQQKWLDSTAHKP